MAWHEAVPSPYRLDPMEPLLEVTKAAHLLGVSVKTLRGSSGFGTPLRTVPR